MAQFDTPSAMAFEAEDETFEFPHTFALVCKELFPFRNELAAKLMGCVGYPIVRLLHYEPAFIPTTKNARMVLVYERPLGGKVIEDIERGSSRVLFDKIRDNQVLPIIDFLSKLADAGFTHRSIRPDNLFYRDKKKTQIVLGDCLSSPPALHQPMLFENIESSFCDDRGRGVGSIINDVYSLGATLLYLDLGRYPLSYKDDASLLSNKIKEGSFNALTYKDTISTSLEEFLREALYDYPLHRWSLARIKSVFNGKKVTQPPVPRAMLATKPFTFNGVPYSSLRELAIAFNREPDRAQKEILSESFSTWLRKSTDSYKLSDEFEEMKREVIANISDENERRAVLVCRTCMLLDKTFPVRFKDLAFMPDALATKIADVLQNSGNMLPLQEAFLSGVLKKWPCPLEEKDFFNERQFLFSASPVGFNDWGKGMEKALYTLAPSCPCLSNLLDSEYVCDVKKLLPALEKVASNENLHLRPMDRNIASFITANMPFVDPALVAKIGDKKDYVSVESIIFLFSGLQKKFGPSSLFKLSGWLGGLLNPVIASYHNKETRKDMENDIPKIVRKGNIIGIADYLNAAAPRTVDADGFAKAVQDYISFAQLEKKLKQKQNEMVKYSQVLGRQIATIMAIIFLLFVIVSEIISNVF